MKNVMLDLETMGVSANSAIVAVGAVEFDIELGILDKFYEVVDLQSSIERGFDIDGKTVQWWMKQSDEARKEIFRYHTLPIKDVLKKFKEWLGEEPLQIWGNGADFDNTILINAYQKFRVMAPWKYTSNRCFRTLKYCFPTLEGVNNSGIAHKAVDDAEWQANYLIKLVKKHKLDSVIK